MSGVIICHTRCWRCMFGECHNPPWWHTWADSDDVEYARAHGLEDPSNQRCGCRCAIESGES